MATNDISHVKVIQVNDNEDVKVSAEYEAQFVLLDPKSLNDAVMKCSKCELVTVHQQAQIQYLLLYPMGEERYEPKRLMFCTYCAKPSIK